MKKIILFLLFAQTVALGFKPVKTDTTIVEFLDKRAEKKIKVITTDNTKFEIPLNLNLENLLKEMGIDSTQRNRAIYLINEEAGVNDTVVVISQSGNQIKIISNLQKNLKPVKTDSEEEEADDDDTSALESTTPSHSNAKYFSKKDFGLYLGINSLSGGNSDLLRLWPSRHVALSLKKYEYLINGRKADLTLSYALEMVWNNFMFQNSNGIQVENNKVVLEDTGFATTKSKLVQPYFAVPLMLNFGFQESKLHLSFGGYAGYRFGGYTKTKDSNRNRERIKGDFGMEDWQYGLMAELGRKNGITLSFRYGLNPLFTTSSPIDANVYSISLRL